jgi:hypothetical protein
VNLPAAVRRAAPVRKLSLETVKVEEEGVAVVSSTFVFGPGTSILAAGFGYKASLVWPTEVLV